LTCVARSWPEVDETEEIVKIAIHNTLINLLGYPLSDETKWADYIESPRERVEEVFRKVGLE
jgi:hypothetical protein